MFCYYSFSFNITKTNTFSKDDFMLPSRFFSELFVEEYRKIELMGRFVILHSIVDMGYSSTSSISSSTETVLCSKIVTFDF